MKLSNGFQGCQPANNFKATWMYTDMDMVNIDMVHMYMVHMDMVDMSKVDMGMTDM